MTPPDAMPPAHRHEHASGLDGFGDHLDRGAELARSVTDRTLDRVAAALAGPVATALDLGAGTGVGTVALARRFPEVQVHSLDLSAELLDRLPAAAAAAGVLDRVHPHVVDLDDDWTGAVPTGVDLAWASLSLHHVADPALVLERVLSALRPGGVFAITEMTASIAFAPDDLGVGRPGLVRRLVEALGATGYPPTADWTAPLSDLGFEVHPPEVTELTLSAGTAEAATFLTGQLAGWRDRLAEHLDAEDLRALEEAEEQIRAGSSPLTSTSGRAVWIAVRPGGSPA